MTSKTRVLNALNKKNKDRIPVHYEGTPEVNHMMLEHLKLDNMEQLRCALGDDLRYVEPDYIGPTLQEYPDGSVEGYWGERYKYKTYEGGAYLEPVLLPFENVFEMDDLDESHFPTAELFRYDNFKEKCQEFEGKYALCIGSAGDMDFMNSIGRARGTEQVLIDLFMDDPVFLRIMDARFQFYYDTHEKLLQAAGGLIDIVMHMCGTVDKFLPRLIKLGLDIQDVIQPTTPEMDVSYLSANFGDNLSFCGSLCVQSTLPHGTVEDVHMEASRRVDLFHKGGMIMGPTHAIQVGTPSENIIEIYKTAGSLATDAELKEIRRTVKGDPLEADTINMSKLF
ncbi:MAG: hypothetical protein B6241_04300 [Spirochaetaceae bacterium 4572_59]|nr:MAG: hypothetical protein B6241_04300 [Spirochaetaceae bacterium 4572_59]